MRWALEGAAVRVAPTMNAQNVANTLWAYATLGWHAAEGSMRWALEGVSVFRELAESMVHDHGLLLSTSPLLLSQLLQAHLASQYLHLGLVTLPPCLLQVAVEAYRDHARNVTVSRGQREVAGSLHRLGISHELEHITADGLFSIDLAIVDQRIAIEFDGPSHFMRNTFEPLGHTRLRDRLLSAMGWHVVSIPFFDWDELLQPEQMDAYVRQRLLQDQEMGHQPPAAGGATSASVPVLVRIRAAGLNSQGCAGFYSRLSE